MNNEEFLKLDVISRINYINSKRREGLSSKEIREKLNISEHKFQEMIRNANYMYSQKDKQYVPKDYKSNEKVVDTINNYKSNEIVVKNNEYRRIIDTLNSIENMNSKLEEMYEWYSLQTKVVEKNQLKIDNFDDEVVTRSYKIYKKIQLEFAEFCKSQPYKTQDIISQMMKEFLQKYK